MLNPLKRQTKRFLKLLTQKPVDSISLLYHATHKSINSNPLVSDNVHNVTPENLHAQLQFLQKKYTFIPIDEMIARLAQNKPLKHVASITFDDGYRSVITEALPVLTNLKIPATLYTTTNLIEHKTFWRDKARYLITNDLVEDFLIFTENRLTNSELLTPENFYTKSKDPSLINSKAIDHLIDGFFQNEGINLAELQHELYLRPTDMRKYDYLQFGNHTHNHYVLSSLSKEEQWQEINTAHETLKKYNVSLSNCFSVPFGGLKTFNEDTISLINDAGFNGCLLSFGYKVRHFYKTLPHELLNKKITFGIRYMPENTSKVKISI